MKIATAPGKMVLMGEYSVLDGHDAVVAAVDVAAVATHDPGARGDIAFDEGGLVRACLDEIADATGEGAPAGRLVVDTGGFRDLQGRKLGLGSSAAAAAALVALLVPTMGIEARHRLTQRAHRRFQHGRGSGIDVAASVYGGVVRFRRRSEVADDVEATPIDVDFAALGLSLVPVFVGHSQDTRDFVAKVQAVDVDVVAAKAAMNASTALFLAGLGGLDGAKVLQAVDGAREAMATMGTRAGIEIVSAPHGSVAQLAKAVGGAAKPSGAGGGDVATAWIPHGQEAAFVASLVSPLSAVPLEIGRARPT